MQSSRSLISKIALLAILHSGLFVGLADAAMITLPQDGETKISAAEISTTPEGVNVNVTKRALGMVLQAIQNASGIHFGVAYDLMEEPVSATIEAPDWSTAVRKLLKPFNRLEVLNKNKTLQRVLIVRRMTEVEQKENIKRITSRAKKKLKPEDTPSDPLAPPPPNDDSGITQGSQPPADASPPPETQSTPSSTPPYVIPSDTPASAPTDEPPPDN